MKALRPAAWGFLLPAPRFHVRASRARGARFLVAVKWHVNGEKKPGKCSARRGQCPFGADAPHYGSKREAQAAAEELIAREAAGFGGEAKASALTECEDGSGLAVDAAGELVS